jgi:hypothetical protein
MKIQYRKIVKVQDTSPKATLKRVVLRLMRGVYKQEVKRLLTAEATPLLPFVPPQVVITPSQRSLLERLLAEQERLIISVILLESQLAGIRPLKHT